VDSNRVRGVGRVSVGCFGFGGVMPVVAIVVDGVWTPVIDGPSQPKRSELLARVRRPGGSTVHPPRTSRAATYAYHHAFSNCPWWMWRPMVAEGKSSAQLQQSSAIHSFKPFTTTFWCLRVVVEKVRWSCCFRSSDHSFKW